MKRYISAVLVPCLLLQLFGCYSFQEITIEELKSFEGSNDVKITTEGIEVLIRRDSTENHTMMWEVGDSSIIVQEKIISQSGKNENSIDKKNEIKLNQIQNIAVDEFDLGNTIVLILLPVTIIALSAAIIYDHIHTGLTTGTLGK